MPKDFNLHVKDVNNGATVTVLEGKALEEQRSLRLTIAGDIDTVRTFLTHRWAYQRDPDNFLELNPDTNLQLVKPGRGVIYVNRDPEKAEIKYLMDPNCPLGTEVTASLIKTPELLQWNINKSHYYTREALLKLVKFNKRYFANADVWDRLYWGLMKLHIGSSDQIVKETDNRANKNISQVKTVDSSSIPVSFILSLPLFKGQGKEDFVVEIGIEKTENTVTFWLESTDLEQTIALRTAEIIDKQLEDFKESFAIVYL